LFYDKDNRQISALDSTPQQLFGPEIKLQEGEQIIGIYGDRDGAEIFDCVGFIVWRPILV
jgi:hypothetical protein